MADSDVPDLDDMEEVLVERKQAAKAAPASVALETGTSEAGESLIRALEEDARRVEEGSGPKYERDPEELARRVQISSIDDEENALQKQMLDAAMQASTEKARAEKEKAASQGFLQGTTIKRGFLNSAPKASPAPAAASGGSAAAKKPAATGSVSGSASAAATIKPAAGGSNPLVLPEVQSAIKDATHGMGSMVMNHKDEWMTPELMARVMADPALAAGMGNPKYMAALQELMSNPKAAQDKYKDDRGLVTWLTTFAGILGDHFTKIGQKKGEEEAAAKKAAAGGDGGIGLTPASTTVTASKPAASSSAPKQPAPAGIMGIGKDGPSTREIVEGARKGKLATEDEEVREVLSNPILVEVLRDPRMHMVLEDCRRDGRRLAYWRTQPQVWTRLKLLETAGLIRLEGF